jgi:F0F1-type ATP synthase alpha subunit
MRSFNLLATLLLLPEPHSCLLLAPTTPSGVQLRRLQHRAPAACAVLAKSPSEELTESLFGQVLSDTDGLITIQPEKRELARVGSMLRFPNGLGTIISERCGLYFAACIDGEAPRASEEVMLMARNLTVPAWDGATASWGGLHDYLGRPLGAGAPQGSSASAVEVFAEPVPAARRRPIGSSLHTGVIAIDALAPIGRGQSMMLFGPDSLPAGSSRTDLAIRVLTAQLALETEVRSLLVLSDGEAARQQAVAKLQEAGVLDQVRILCASTPVESLVAASAACSIAEACGADDTLVIVDSLRPHLRLWREVCGALAEHGVAVSPEEEGSQQRAYYSRLVERAARRKQSDGGAADDGGSLTLLLLQPSVSVLAAEGAQKAEYTLEDFESGGFTQTVLSRVKMLAQKGVPLTQDVLIKVGIPLPGSDHPVAGNGQRSAQHLEELTSLVDGHIDLRESLAAQGRVPPIDPANSLTRIGVGSTQLRSLSATPAMASVRTRTLSRSHRPPLPLPTTGRRSPHSPTPPLPLVPSSPHPLILLPSSASLFPPILPPAGNARAATGASRCERPGQHRRLRKKARRRVHGCAAAAIGQPDDPG